MNAVAHLPLVQRIARRMARRLPPSVERDDLIQAGAIGLLDAEARYVERPDSTFEAFASPRIQGAMLDELRRGDHLSRDARRRQLQAQGAVQRLQHVLGREPTHGEVAADLGIPLSEYHRHGPTSLVSLDDHEDAGHAVEADTGTDPLDSLQRAQRLVALAAEIECLPDREKYVMRMRYEHNLTLVDIAVTMGVSESRVFQIHTNAVRRLRRRLSDY